MNILREAQTIINGQRKQAYGPPEQSFSRIAKLWSVVVGKELNSKDVALMMVLFKVSREINTHHTDNLVDVAGYAQILENLYGVDN